MQRSWLSRYFLRVLSDRHGIPTSDVVVDAKGPRLGPHEHGRFRLIGCRSEPCPRPTLLPVWQLLPGIALLAALVGGIALSTTDCLAAETLSRKLSVALSNPFDAYDNDIARPPEFAAVSRALTDMSKTATSAEADRALYVGRGQSRTLRTPPHETAAGPGNAEGCRSRARRRGRAQRDPYRRACWANSSISPAGYEAEETRAGSACGPC